MEPYGNMNPSAGRGYGKPMNQNCRNSMNPNSMSPNLMNQNSRNQNCNRCSGQNDRVNNYSGRNMADNQRRRMQGGGRNVEVECVCKMTPNCHQNDPMEKLGDQFPLVMAYVPWQQWGDLYDAECGLMQGTIFKDLDYVFCGERC